MGTMLAVMFLGNPYSSRYLMSTLQKHLPPDFPLWILIIFFFLVEFFVFVHLWATALFYMFFALLNLFTVQYWSSKMQ